MKTIRDILTKTAVLVISSASALAITLPVAEDTFNAPHGVLTAANGKAATLLLNTNQAALVKFDLSALPAAFTPTNIVSARLKLYIVTTRTPGDLVATLITSAWTETVLTNTPMPSFDTTIIGEVSAAKVVAKRFVSIDVTAAVIAALNGSGPNFGFLLHDTKGQTYIPSKEGPSQGPAAELEIDANLAQNATASGAFPGSLSVGGDLMLASFLRQGSETGTSEPAGRGIIIRHVQSTNSAVGSVVARTDTLTLERDGTLDGWRIVNAANAGNIIIIAFSASYPGGQMITLGPNPYPAGTNIFYNTGNTYFRCSFGDTSGAGHYTEVSLMKAPIDNNPSWTGFLTSTYNQ